MAEFAPLAKFLPLLDKMGKMTQRVQDWTQSVNRLAILENTGSPEGKIEARTTRQYMDQTGGAGAILYIKQKNDILGDRTKGWVAVG